MEILLVRHGKPVNAINSKLSASGFAHWVRNYNRSTIESTSLPPKILVRSLNTHFVVSSDLIRAIDSVTLCLKEEPDLTLPLLREMDIPRYKLPFVLNAYTWLFISRFFWFLGFNGKVESFKMAKMRAILSAEKLQNLAIQHKKVVVFGHGIMNTYIAKELRRQGWQSSGKSSTYWGMIKLVMEPSYVS